MTKPITILLCALLALTGIMLTGSNPDPEAKEISAVSNAYTGHSPILIESNADFDAAHGVTGGTGSSINPWIIEGWEIDGSGSAFCIKIQDTTDYFVIMNCYIHGASDSGEHGIYLLNAHNSSIEYNHISNNFYGIQLRESCNNNITHNEINKNAGSIWLYSVSEPCEYNIIYANNVTNGTGWCTRLDGDNNLVYHNNYINNPIGPVDWNTNDWDNGYPDGGNYWDSYSGDDIYQGPNQDLIGSDGIGDTPVFASGGGQDNYPLIERYGGKPPTSTINTISPYLCNSSPATITATASDDYCGLKNVTLWYRFSLENVTWQAWESYETNTESPWSWPFDFPKGDGYYEFYSIAVDNSSKEEEAPIDADALCLFNNPPIINLTSPINNSIIDGGTVIDLNIIDSNLDYVSYSKVGDSNQTLISPYDLSTSEWADGQHNLEVYAIDNAGYFSIELFTFTVDSTNPDIVLVSPTNDSLIQPGVIIDFNITDAHLDSVTYSINNGIIQNFSYPFNINTTGWVDGLYEIDILILDTLDHITRKNYLFTIDGTIPSITISYPANSSIDIPTTANISVTFSESIANSNCTFTLEHGMINTPSSYWNSNNTVFTWATELQPNTTYHLTIENATDMAGNVMANHYVNFTTWADNDGDGSPDSADLDDDNDGTPDIDDDLPFDSTEVTDTDGDGIGNNADDDDDGDGVLDIDDKDSLDPAITTDDYTWVYILAVLAIVGVIGVIAFIKFKGKPKIPEPKVQEEV